MNQHRLETIMDSNHSVASSANIETAAERFMNEEFNEYRSKSAGASALSVIGPTNETEPRTSSAYARSSIASKHISHLLTNLKLGDISSASFKSFSEQGDEIKHTPSRKRGTKSPFTGSTRSFQKLQYASSSNTSNRSILTESNSCSSLLAVVEIARIQEVIDDQKGVSMEEFIEKYEDLWIKAIILAGKRALLQDRQRELKGSLFLCSDSVESLKALSKNIHKQSLEKDPSKSGILSTKLFSGSLKQLFVKSSSKKSLNISSDENEKTISKTYFRENALHPIHVQTSTEILSSTLSPTDMSENNTNTNPKSPMSAATIHEEKLEKNDENALDDLFGEGLDNILPLTITTPKISANSSIRKRSPTGYYPNPNSNPKSKTGNGSQESISKDYSDSQEQQKSRKNGLFAKLKSFFKRKVTKSKKKYVSIRKEPLKVPPDFVLPSIIKPVKGEILIDNNMMEPLLSNTTRYVFKGVPPPIEISFDTKRVGFNPNAINISEAIRVSELGEVPGVGKGACAVIPVNFVSQTKKRLKE